MNAFIKDSTLEDWMGRVARWSPWYKHTFVANLKGNVSRLPAQGITLETVNKRIKDNIRLRAHLIEGLGRTKDLKMVDWIVDEATRSHHDEIRAAAGKALGEFTNLKTKGRRKVVKELIKSWGSLHSSATSAVNLDRNAPIDFGPETARRTLRVIEAKWVRTLSKLTGQSMSKFPDWQRWQNKNRRWVAPGMKK